MSSPPAEPPRPTPFTLALGANQGHPRRQLRHALDRLEEALGPLKVAPLYRTTAVVLPDTPPQPDYLNTAAAGETTLSPRELLALAKRLEQEAGRDLEGPRWGPRPLDIDLLTYGDVVLDTPELILPHPRMRERLFVMVPLAEIAAELRLPPDGVTVGAVLRGLEEKEAGKGSLVPGRPQSR